VDCDIVNADPPVVNDGTVLFIGKYTHVTIINGFKSDKQFVNTLEDNIVRPGAPHKLISNSAQVTFGCKFQDILQFICLNGCSREPYHQQENDVERRNQTIDGATNHLLYQTSAPPYTWLISLKYVWYILHHTYNDNINGVPLSHFTGLAIDICIPLCFHFWKKVYFKHMKSGFPSESVDVCSYCVFLSGHCGLATDRVITRLVISPADKDNPNLCAALLCGEDNNASTLYSLQDGHTIQKCRSTYCFT
jgi:hypothetical protein